MTGRQANPTGANKLTVAGAQLVGFGLAPTLSLTVARLDRSELSMGGQFVADIRVTNTGTEPVILPTVLAYEFGDGFAGGPYAVQASLGLPVVDAEGREHTLAGTVLRARPADRGLSNRLGLVKA